jgi:MSHA biogenesis protein MshQ
VRVPLTARISTTGLPAVTGTFSAACTPSPACLGTANVVAPFTISRGANGDGPYRALAIGIAPVDSDGVTTIYDLDTVNVVTGANNHTNVGSTEVRYGRIKVSNAYGSELLPLALTATAQYFTSTEWVNSTTDNLTNLTLAATYPLLDKNGVATGSATSASRTPASNFLAGQLSIKLAKPAGGTTLTGTATINPTNNPAAASTYLPVTPGTATFGVYKGKNDYIYRRESF